VGDPAAEPPLARVETGAVPPVGHQVVVQAQVHPGADLGIGPSFIRDGIVVV